MRVLDVGCGGGDLSLVAADLVGSSGSVLGIDRSSKAVQRATARAASFDVRHVSFQVVDVEGLEDSMRFDAVIGRFVLMYMVDPAATLRRLVGHLEPGGRVAFLEMDTMVARTIPSVPRVETVIDWVLETFRRAGVTLYLGSLLWRVFRDAGLPEHTLVVCQKLNPPTSTTGVTMLAEIVRSLLPMMEKLGVVRADEVGIETLAEEIQGALVENDAALLMPCVVGAHSCLRQA